MLGSALSGGLGSAVVYVSANTQKLTADLAKAKAITEGQTASMGAGMSSMLAKFGPQIAVGATAAVGAYAAFAVKSFQEAEMAALKLNNSISGNIKMLDVSRGSWDELTSSIQMTTGASDEALTEAAAMLGQFGASGSAIQEMLPLLADLSIKMGTDVTGAAQGVGKALLGSTRALKAAGIDFKATGDAEADMATITEMLRQKVGGMGAAFGQTLPGQIAIAKEKFEEGAESVGKNLTPALIGATKAVLALASGLGKLAQAGGGIANISTDFMKMVPVTSLAGHAFDVYGQTLDVAGQKAQALAEADKQNVLTMKQGNLTAAQAQAAFMRLGESEQVAGEHAYFLASQAGIATTGITGLAQSELDAVAATEELIAAQEELAGELLGLDDAAQRAEDAQRDLTAARKAEARAIKESGRNSKEAKEAHAAVEDAVRASTHAQLDLNDAKEKYSEALVAAGGNEAKAIADLKATAKAGGATKKEIAEMVREIKAIPKSASTNIRIAGVETALRDVQDLQSALQTVSSGVWTVGVALEQIGNNIGRRTKP